MATPAHSPQSSPPNGDSFADVEPRLERDRPPLASRRCDGSQSPQPGSTPPWTAQIPSSSSSASETTPAANLHSPLDVFLTDYYFSKGTSLPVATVFSDQFRKKYPQVRGMSKVGFLVEGPDGKVRRFPKDAGTLSFIKLSGMPELMGRSTAQQLSWIYDARREHVRECIGEYSLDTASQTTTFNVRGRPVQSISGNSAVYPLGEGKWMMAQAEFRACMEAAEEMLLAEGKPADQVLEQIKDRFDCDEQQRREVSDLVTSLRARSGKDPVVLSQIDPIAPGALDQLQEAVEKHGPCVLCAAGHARVLDRIEKTQQGYVLEVRDPFSCSALKINMHDEFTRPPRPKDHRHRWDAVFLGSGKA